MNEKNKREFLDRASNADLNRMATAEFWIKIVNLACVALAALIFWRVFL